MGDQEEGGGCSEYGKGERDHLSIIFKRFYPRIKGIKVFQDVILVLVPLYSY